MRKKIYTILSIIACIALLLVLFMIAANGIYKAYWGNQLCEIEKHYDADDLFFVIDPEHHIGGIFYCSQLLGEIEYLAPETFEAVSISNLTAIPYVSIGE